MSDHRVDELAEQIRACPPGQRLLPVGGGSKPSLSRAAGDGIDTLDAGDLRGIVAYDPAELTLTARPATPVAEVSAELAEHGQYLPFDPLLAQSGATLGGTVAAGASGSNALRHGGVRDFVIGVRFLDGTGTLVASGGRVVKNAAGFDLAKLMVGSLGSLGVLTELSLKVFPRPRATATLAFELGTTATAIATAARLAGGPRELDAVDIHPGGRLLVRLGGDASALMPRADRLEAAAGVAAAERIEGEAERALWHEQGELTWAPPGASVVRVPLTARVATALEEVAGACGGAVRFALATNVALVTAPPEAQLGELADRLAALGLGGLVLRGPEGAAPLIGVAGGGSFAARIRAALDPRDRFREVA